MDSPLVAISGYRAVHPPLALAVHHRADDVGAHTPSISLGQNAGETLDTLESAQASGSGCGPIAQ